MAWDYRDDVIETFAASEAAWIERIAGLTLERDSYRLLCQQALHTLAAAILKLDRLHAINRQLREAQQMTRREPLEAA